MLTQCFLYCTLCCLQVRATLQQYTLEAQAERTPLGRRAVELRKASKVTRRTLGSCTYSNASIIAEGCVRLCKLQLSASVVCCWLCTQYHQCFFWRSQGLGHLACLEPSNTYMHSR